MHVVCRHVHTCTVTRVTDTYLWSQAHTGTKAHTPQPLGVCARVSRHTLHPAQPPALGRASRQGGPGNTPSREESQSQSALITSHGIGSSIILEWQAGYAARLLASQPPPPVPSISPWVTADWLHGIEGSILAQSSDPLQNHKHGPALGSAVGPLLFSLHTLRAQGGSPTPSQAGPPFPWPFTICPAVVFIVSFFIATATLQ